MKLFGTPLVTFVALMIPVSTGAQHAAKNTSGIIQPIGNVTTVYMPYTSPPSAATQFGTISPTIAVSVAENKSSVSGFALSSSSSGLRSRKGFSALLAPPFRDFYFPVMFGEVSMGHSDYIWALEPICTGRNVVPVNEGAALTSSEFLTSMNNSAAEAECYSNAGSCTMVACTNVSHDTKYGSSAAVWMCDTSKGSLFYPKYLNCHDVGRYSKQIIEHCTSIDGWEGVVSAGKLSLTSEIDIFVTQYPSSCPYIKPFKMKSTSAEEVPITPINQEPKVESFLQKFLDLDLKLRSKYGDRAYAITRLLILWITFFLGIELGLWLAQQEEWLRRWLL